MFNSKTRLQQDQKRLKQLQTQFNKNLPFFDLEDIQNSVDTLKHIFKRRNFPIDNLLDLLDNDEFITVGSSEYITDIWEEDLSPEEITEAKRDAIRLLFNMKSTSLLLYIDHCLRWVFYVAMPIHWYDTNDYLKTLLKYRNDVLSMLYFMDPEGYKDYIKLHPEKLPNSEPNPAFANLLVSIDKIPKKMEEI